MSVRLTEIEAAIRVRMSPKLLRWFTSHAPKHGDTRKLPFEDEGGEYFYDSQKLDDFDAYLKGKWNKPSGSQRPHVPQAIKDEIIIESDHKCAFCQYIAGGEGAHIDSVSVSCCNHPHNLIWTCPNHHQQYDNGLKVETLLTPVQVHLVKGMLLDTRLRTWRAERRLVNSIVSLIADLEKLRGYLSDPDLLAVRNTIKSQARTVVSYVQAEAAKKPDKRTLETPPASGAYDIFIKKIGALKPATSKSIEEIVDDVTEAKDAYLIEEGLTMCPLCEGSGTHRYRECPVCEGAGAINKEFSDHIDLADYEEVDCPLCEGSGRRNFMDCVVCGGEKTMDRETANRVDMRDYEEVDCPLCDGSGSHRHSECPVCGGDKTMDREVANTVDLRAYEEVDCPLCDGSGRHKYEECPVCEGQKTMKRETATGVDLRDYEQVDCPLCEGSGRHKHEECPVCEGEKTMNRETSARVDLRDYEEVDCPLCEGSGSYKHNECPACGGEKTMNREMASRVDSSEFE